MDLFARSQLRSRLSSLQVSRQGALIVAIPVTCLIASLLAIAWLRGVTIETRNQENRSRQVLLEANRLLTTMVRAQSSMALYGITRSSEFLTSFSNAKDALPKTLKKLNNSIADASQRQRLQAIQSNIEAHLTALEKMRQATDTLGAASDRSLVLNARAIESKSNRDTSEQLIAEFSAIEERKLNALHRQVVQWQSLTTGFQWFALCVGLGGGWAAWRLFQSLDKQLQARSISLKESKARIQAVVDSAADGIITLDELGNIQSFNPAAARIFHDQSARVTGANLRELIAESVREDTTGDPLSYFLAIPTAKLSSCQRETVGRRWDGSTFPMELAISSVQLAAERLFIAICRDITERRQADEIVRNQAQMLDLANDSIIVFDLDGNIRYWNQGARRLYGWKKKQAIAQNVHALLRTEFPQPLQELKAVLLQQGYWEGVLVQVKQDGTKVSVASSWTLQRDENNSPVAILEINNDITQRQEAAKALRESQQMLQLVMASIPQYIFWKDRNAIYLGCNDNVARLLGLDSPDAIVGLTDANLPFSREQAQLYRSQDRQVIERNQPLYHVIERLSVQLPNRKPMWVDVNKIPLTDATGTVMGVLCSFEDITERKRAEAALAESEQLFRAVFEQAAVGMAQNALDGRWLMVNQKLCDILGYSREELLEMQCWQITHADDFKLNQEFLQRLLAEEIPTYSMEKRYIRKDGSPVWTNLTVSLLRDAEGDRSLLSVVEDISDRKAAEEALRSRAAELSRTTAILAQTTAVLKKRNQELDQFAYVVSHDLKAPLRAIANLSTWIEEDLSDKLTDETQHQMNLLRGRVHRMEALIEGLLQYSRVGRINNTKESVNVSKLLGEIIDSLAPPPTFTVEVSPGMPLLFTERLLLGQVFSNLIGNAIKHNRRTDGRVHISVQDLGDFYEFAVADNGPGIAPQYHEKIFVIFSTLEARDKVENTGIGLSLVKKIVENQGGTIQVESRDGEGATFRFTWPKPPAP